MLAHIDADSFFASVLSRQNPSLRGKPLLALGMGGGCVIAASYEAKAKGVRTGMTLKEALKLAPEALRLPSDFQETGLASEQIETVLQDVCPRIEQMSIDEWFLDLATVPGGVPKDLPSSAATLQADVLSQTALSVSVGIAPSKTLAKMASEYRKPGGVTVISPLSQKPPSPNLFPHGGRGVPSPPSPVGVGAPSKGEGWVGVVPAKEMGVEEFLSDRPAAAIPGIGPRRLVHCEANGWKTAWDVAQAHPETLKELFGRPGVELKWELLGERVYAIVETAAPPKSVSRARSFRATPDRGIVWAHLLRHAEYTVLKMRRHRLACRGISAWIRDERYEYKSSHCSLPRPMDTEEELQPFLRRCFADLWQRNSMCTQTGLALWNLCPPTGHQFSLFEPPERFLRQEKLQDALDDLHRRFGRNAITRGSALPVKTGTKRSWELSAYE